MVTDHKILVRSSQLIAAQSQLNVSETEQIDFPKQKFRSGIFLVDILFYYRLNQAILDGSLRALMSILSMVYDAYIHKANSLQALFIRHYIIDYKITARFAYHK